MPLDIKVAVYLSTDEKSIDEFYLCDAVTDNIVYSAKAEKCKADKWAMKSAYRLDFSSFEQQGGYYILCGDIKSKNFRIAPDVYRGASDYLLNYMRQQRCGDNPYTDALCHTHDGYIVDHPTRNGEKIDVTGGWHDATDYLQYQTTSATAIYQLLFAYSEIKDKSVFEDNYDERGRLGKNGIPDILDEAMWGLLWLDKMNPEDKVMFSQIADDRDHAGFRLPNRDKVDYGWGPGEGRPVYFVTGKPQGLGRHKNRTTGVSSVAGKFASSFALGAEVFKNIDPTFSRKLMVKAEQAYRFGESNLGNTQTACLVSPYFYEEDNYTDDLELAAATFASISNIQSWEKRADYWGELEPITPWMELGRGRHYQWYPFINIGHYLQANSTNPKIAKKYQEFLKAGLEALRKRGKDDPFLHGVPYLWCSNNLTSAAATQARLYYNSSGDSTYLYMEAALRDWLLGCNPWGTSMIVGYPVGADYPTQPHSSYTVVLGDLTYGGLVDGPIYRDLFMERAGNSLTKEDSYAIFNNGAAVYHDDIGDYASNEPTMDGTAGLAYYFAAMQEIGNSQSKIEVNYDKYGAIDRFSKEEPSIYLTFTVDSLFQGGEKILKVLNKQKIKGSFFFTGNALRNPQFTSIIEKIIKDGHYVGCHSNKHLLYASWSNRDSLLVTEEQIIEDLKSNATELFNKFGVSKENSLWFISPYEHYNSLTVKIANDLGYKVINYTPGTLTAADHTLPLSKNYHSSQRIIDALYGYEKVHGLNGAILLIHPGVEEERTDRLYNRLDEIVTALKKLKYNFKSLNK